jgi:putative addiction module killer protein
MKIVSSDAYAKWYQTQPKKIQAQILARLMKIENEDYFGTHKNLGDFLWELKFNNGNRIYYTVIKKDNELVFLILGGNKNGQQKDIDKAKKVAKELHS